VGRRGRERRGEWGGGVSGHQDLVEGMQKGACMHVGWWWGEGA